MGGGWPHLVLLMPIDIDATQVVDDGAGGTRPLSVDDWKTPATGAASDDTLVEVRDRLPVALDDGALKVADVFTGGEALPDQNGAGGVLTFTFAAPVDLVWVRAASESRCDPFGGTPTASAGIVCAADEPTPITVRTSVVKVFSPSGRVAVWGFR